MQMQFNGSSKTFECTEPIEQKLFKSGTAAGWMLMFGIYGYVDSTELDGYLTADGISELTFTTSDENEFTLSGYSVVSSCTIRHNDATPIAELQFRKDV